MTESFQSFLIKIMNAAYGVTCRISEKARALIVQVLYIGLFGIYIAFRAKIFKHALYRELLHDVSVRYLFCTAILLIIVVLTINAPLCKVKWRASILYTQLLTGLGIILISFLHPIGAGYRLFGFQLLLVFPCFFLVWNNRGDYQRLIKPIVNAVSIIGIVFYAGTYLMAFRGRLMMDPGSIRCAGVMPNANSFSLIGMELVLCAIYLLAVEGGGWINTFYCSITLGMGLGIVLEGQMRIAIITIGICSIVTAYYILRFFRNKANMKMFAHVLVLIFLAGIMIQLTAMMIDINQQVIARKQGVVTADAGDSSQSSELMNPPPEVQDESDVTDRLIKTEGQDLNSYSSGRIWIWQNYARELNMLGHNFDEYDPVLFTGKKNLPFAHNIFLEIAYRCGVPVGLMAVLYYLICGIICIKFLFFRSENKRLYLLFPIISAIAFALEALLDCAVLPFFQAEALLFYIAVAVMIDKNEN